MKYICTHTLKLLKFVGFVNDNLIMNGVQENSHGYLEVSI